MDNHCKIELARLLKKERKNLRCIAVAWETQLQVYEAAKMAFMIVNRDLELLYGNKYGADIYGYEYCDSIGKKVIDLIIPEERRNIAREMLHMVLTFGNLHTKISDHIDIHGTIIKVAAMVAPLEACNHINREFVVCTAIKIE